MWRGAAGSIPNPLPTGLTIPSPTITGATITSSNVPYTLGQSAIPFIGLSSGSVAANGAISGITALPRAYANAYCYFPANTLATVSAAGWYYCTFSTTTAGVAFLDTYTSGAPAIPASPAPVVDGKGAFTGVTTETAGPTITLPAGALGINGQFQIWSAVALTNNANAKGFSYRWSGAAGTIIRNVSVASVLTYQDVFHVANRGRADLQSVSVSTSGGIFTGTAGTETALAIDSSAATTIVLGFTRGTATDNFVLLQYQIQVAYSA